METNSPLSSRRVIETAEEKKNENIKYCIQFLAALCTANFIFAGAFRRSRSGTRGTRRVPLILYNSLAQPPLV